MEKMIIYHRDLRGFIYHTETVNIISVQELIERSKEKPQQKPVISQEETEPFDPWEILMKAAQDSSERV